MHKCNIEECENLITKPTQKSCSRDCSNKYRSIIMKGNTHLKGHFPSDETKQKIREKKLGVARDPLIGRKISKSLNGIKHSEERIANHSKRMEGNQYGKGKQPFKGRTHTKETIQKMKDSSAKRLIEDGSSSGWKLTEETKQKMRDSAALREYTGSQTCNYYEINGIKCQGSSEKKYIESLINDKEKLPTKCNKFISTPFGNRMLDFEFDEVFIEIKSEWTYTFYLDSNQKIKDDWITENIKPVKVIVI